MIDQPRAFLPAGALSQGRIRDALSGVLDGWAETFFPYARADIASVPEPGSFVSGEAIVALSKCATILLTGPGKRSLLELALGETLQDKVLLDHDRRLLDAFAARITDDLVKRIDALLGAGGGPPMCLNLSLANQTIGSLKIGSTALIEMVRQNLPNRPPQGRFSSSRLDAAAQTAIELEAVLGRSMLTIQDAKALTIGDVLVLDHAFGDDVELRFVRDGALATVGQLVSENGRRAITIGKRAQGDQLK